MHANSLEAYASGREELFPARARAVLGVVTKPMTDRAVMLALGFTDPNAVRPRITELVEVGALVEVGTVRDNETGRNVRLVDRPGQSPQPMTTDYRAKGAEDYNAGRRDSALYDDTNDRGREYRAGWQQARRDAENRTPEEWQAKRDAVLDALADGHPNPEGYMERWADENPPPPAAPALIPFAKWQERVVGLRRRYRVPLMSDLPSIPSNGFRVASTFSGCGGSSLGYKLAGFEVLWANEFIPAAQETYRANHPTTKLDPRDIREIKAEEILAELGMRPGELDLFDGSPPCASFSTAGIREEGWGRVKKYSDTKQRTDDLFFEFVRLLEGLRPKVFIAENVAGLTVGVAKEKMLGDGQLDAFESQEETILHQLMDAGYRVGLHVLDAADLGVPQARRRAIFVGIRKDLASAYNLEPAWPLALPYRFSIRDALEAPIPAEYEVPGVNIERYAIGAEWARLRPGEQSEKYFSLVRVDPNEVCPTICASHGSGSIASITHWAEPRKFSIGELRRLGGFPDDFKLTGTYEQQWERIGRAVPPVMMAAIAATVRDEILAKIPKSAPALPPAEIVPAPTPSPAAETVVAARGDPGQLELF